MTDELLIQMLKDLDSLNLGLLRQKIEGAIRGRSVELMREQLEKDEANSKE